MVIAYREIRLIETEVIVELVGEYNEAFAGKNVTSLSLVDVDQMYGIEIEEFPARIAETALWMMDHIIQHADLERVTMSEINRSARRPFEKADLKTAWQKSEWTINAMYTLEKMQWVARIDDGGLDAVGEKARRAGCAMANHHHVDAHRLEISRRVHQRLTLAHAGS